MSTPRGRRARPAPLVAAAVIGLGLAIAPVAFEMFDRAPQGGTMIEEFRPFMTTRTVDDFRGHLDRIGQAEAEVRTTVRPALARRPGVGEAQLDERYPQVAELHRRWPAIDEDMGAMLDTMADNVDNFADVDALPPFPLFPWFFVLPGVLAAGLAVAAFRAPSPRPWLIALGGLGLGLLAAPAVFQMFTRAPQGGRMIDDFRPLMTQEKVTQVQGYFLTLGAAEGQLRTEVVPALGQGAAGATPTPAVSAWSDQWGRISQEMAPMIGAMADNVDNFAAVDALPPFALFPWFFVAPGLLLAGLAVAARPPAPAPVPAVVPERSLS